MPLRLACSQFYGGIFLSGGSSLSPDFSLLRVDIKLTSTFTEPEADLFGWTGSLASPRDPPASASLVLGLQVYATCNLQFPMDAGV